MGRRRMTFAERLEKNSIPEPNSGCLLWTGAIGTDGYGVFTYWEDGKSKTTSAHRAAWISKHGPIPPGKCVCHKCDVKLCIEDAHFWLGTNDENMADMVAKGRAAKPIGIKHPAAKITDDTVRQIRTSTDSGVFLARQFGLSTANISLIRNRKAWVHVTEASLG